MKPHAWTMFVGVVSCVLCFGSPFVLAAVPENTLRIHYNRSDGDYAGWGLHLWGDVNLSPAVTWNSPYKATGKDSFGVYFDVPLDAKPQRVGFILHLWEEKNYPKDLYWVVSEHGLEIWQLEGEGTIYTTIPPHTPSSSRSAAERIPPEKSATMTERVMGANIPSISREQRAYNEAQRRKTELEIEKLRLETQKLRTTAAKIAQESKPIVLPVPVIEKAVDSTPTTPAPAPSASPSHMEVSPVENRSVVAQEDNWLLWALGGLGSLLVLVFAGVAYRLQTIRTIVKEQQTILRHTQMLMQQEPHTKQGPHTGAHSVEVDIEHDDLTGLPLRKHFLKRVDESISHAKKYGESFAVLNIEMINFSEINQQMGHDFSDIVLKHSADRIRSLLRERDFLACDKGNRFLVLLTPTVHHYIPKQLAEKIHKELFEPIVFDRMIVQVRSKIGISLFPDDAEQGLLLVHQAEHALQRVLANPLLVEAYYTERFNIDYQQKDVLFEQVVKALDEQSFELHYQPLYDVKTLRLLGFEALLRCKGEALIDISPPQIMSVLEEAGLAMRLFHWQFEVAFAQLQDWQNNTLSLSQDTFVSINLLAAQFFDAELLSFLQNKIKAKALNPVHLRFEVVESVLMANLEKSAPVLQALSELGILVAIDNFGTALSALPQMKHLPLHSVKMSGAFLSNLDQSTGDLAIAEALMALASSLRLQVIVFGVEKKEQVDYLQGHECDAVQGNLLCSPCDATLMSERLHAAIMHPPVFH